MQRSKVGHLALFSILLLSFTGRCLAGEPSKFFASKEVQERVPEAFALQPAAHKYIKEIQNLALKQRMSLVNTILDDPLLSAALQRWDSLSFDDQTPFLKRIFSLECHILGII